MHLRALTQWQRADRHGSDGITGGRGHDVRRSPAFSKSRASDVTTFIGHGGPCYPPGCANTMIDIRAAVFQKHSAACGVESFSTGVPGRTSDNTWPPAIPVKFPTCAIPTCS
jgi:hypothetical protein